MTASLQDTEEEELQTGRGCSVMAEEDTGETWAQEKGTEIIGNHQREKWILPRVLETRHPPQTPILSAFRTIGEDISAI